jgi:hypothetical protein
MNRSLAAINRNDKEKNMKKNERNKEVKNLRLSDQTIAELNRLSQQYDKNLTGIIEWAVAQFAYDQRRGI